MHFAYNNYTLYALWSSRSKAIAHYGAKIYGYAPLWPPTSEAMVQDGPHGRSLWFPMAPRSKGTTPHCLQV